jgi:hypothetical protein
MLFSFILRQPSGFAYGAQDERLTNGIRGVSGWRIGFDSWFVTGEGSDFFKAGDEVDTVSSVVLGERRGADRAF